MPYPIGSMYGMYANIGGILMVNVTIYIYHTWILWLVDITDKLVGGDWNHGILLKPQ
jgi:hypothetical protein